MKKYEELVELLSTYESVVIAFSGGVDSSFLAKAAYDALGENAMAVTIVSPYIQNREIEDAKDIANKIGIKHHIMKKPWAKVLHDNPQNRCYVCKQGIFQAILEYGKKEGFSYVAEGSNLDDTKEYRPGKQALKELGVLTPMVELSLTKDEIRKLSHKLELPTWNKPSSACLLTRFPYEKKIDEDELRIVEKAETYLASKGYDDIRVRFENKSARIEMPSKMRLKFMIDFELPIMIENLKSMGFLQVTLDLQTFRHEAKKESKEKSYA